MIKTTLAQYIQSEQEQIFRQQETIEKVDRFLKELDIISSELGIEDPKTKKLDELKNTQSNDHDVRDGSTNVLPQDNKLKTSKNLLEKQTFSKLEDITTKENEVDSLYQEEDHLFELISNRNPPRSSNRRNKCSNYREELLQQIEEKKRQKQMEIEQEKAADQELERKVSQQRLSMYLDYVEERKRGDFVKCKPPIERDTDSSLGLPPKATQKSLTLRPKSSATEQSRRAISRTESITSNSNAINTVVDPVQSTNSNKGFNILANLSEVRQIMQHDHIEMLQQLLDLHLK